jgi:hypothetical protein
MAMNKVRINVAGWTACPFFQRAWNVTNAIGIMHPNRVQAVKIELATRDDYKVIYCSSSLLALALLAVEFPRLAHLTCLCMYFSRSPRLHASLFLYSYGSQTRSLS